MRSDSEKDAGARHAWPRGPLAFLLVAAALSLGLTAWRLAVSSETGLLVTLVCDDGYYYAEWARRLAAGEGPSFDGRSYTDGVRPVWALSLVPIYALVSDPHLALKLSALWGALLHVSGFVLLAHVLMGRIAPWAAALAGALGVLSPTFAALGAGVMDWPMTAFLAIALAAATSALLARPRAGLAALLGVGALAALNLLERPESALLVAWLAWVVGRRGRWREVGIVAAAAAALVLPAVLLSIRVFGRYGSVAGELKAQHSLGTLDVASFLAAFARAVTAPLSAPFTGLGLPVHTWIGALGALGPILFAAGVLGLVAWLARGRPAGDEASRAVRDGVVRPLLLVGVLHCFTVSVLLHQQLSYGRWYLAAQDIAVIVLVALAFDGAGRRLTRRAATLAAMALMVAQVVGIALYERQTAALRRAAAEEPPLVAQAADWLARNVPTTTRVAAHNAGYLAYHSPQAVTNLDGLMNSWEYAEKCVLESDPGQRAVNFLRYLVEQELQYVVDPWYRSMGDQVPAVAFGPQIGTYFQRVATLAEHDPGPNPQDYQVYRVDLERARTDLASFGLLAPAGG